MTAQQETVARLKIALREAIEDGLPDSMIQVLRSLLAKEKEQLKRQRVPGHEGLPQ
jgi:phage FluMu gp28-like protein